LEPGGITSNCTLSVFSPSLIASNWDDTLYGKIYIQNKYE